MRYLPALCVSLVLAVLAGCAGNPPVQPPMPPVDGQCGDLQDYCLLGTPSGIGETAPPYGWVCLGRNGGKDAPCSVPTARIDEGEVFAGQNELEEKVKAAGPLRGLNTIVDGTLDHPDCEPPWCHAHLMKTYALEMGIPEENLRVVPFFDTLYKGGEQDILDNTLVFSAPTTFAYGTAPGRLAFLRQHDVLIVAAAGNKDTFGGRDTWYKDHELWSEDRLDRSWDGSMETFSTGKVIIAKYAEMGDDGVVIPYEGNVKCGLAMEFCYSIMTPQTLRCLENGCYQQNLGSSGASINLGALAFYLFQLWDTPHEVVDVLNVCAEDVGDPGIDEEFGRGIVSVVCDTVRHRERRVVSESVSMNSASPVLTEMVRGSSSGRFGVFHAVRGRSLRTATGHVGARLPLKGTDLLVSGGTGYAPLGVRSSLLRAARTPFMEVGGERPVLSRVGGTVFLLGAYGRTDGGDLSARLARAGVRYERHLRSGALTLYAGYRLVQGRIGIPGHRQAGAGPVPFSRGSSEARLSFSLGL